MVKFIEPKTLTQAHNLGWKLALVIKQQAADPDKLLDSYTFEVYYLLNVQLILENSDYQENHFPDLICASGNYSCTILVRLVFVSPCCNGGSDPLPASVYRSYAPPSPLRSVSLLKLVSAPHEPYLEWHTINSILKAHQSRLYASRHAVSSFLSHKFPPRCHRNDTFEPHPPRCLQTGRSLHYRRPSPPRTSPTLPKICHAVQILPNHFASGYPSTHISYWRYAKTELGG